MTIFWDTEGPLLIDFLPTGTTMNGQYYANLIDQLKVEMVKLRRGKRTRGRTASAR